MIEKCKDCKNFVKLYVPSIYKDVPKDAYVCDLFREETEVTWLGTGEKAGQGRCEMFTRRWNNGENKGSSHKHDDTSTGM